MTAWTCGSLFHCPSLRLEESANVQAWGESELDAGRWILSPYEEMRPGWAAVAWGVKMEQLRAHLGASQEFYDVDVGHGREDITSEPPGSCG